VIYIYIYIYVYIYIYIYIEEIPQDTDPEEFERLLKA